MNVSTGLLLAVRCWIGVVTMAACVVELVRSLLVVTFNLSDQTIALL